MPAATPFAAVTVPSAPARVKVTITGPPGGVGVGAGSTGIDWSVPTKSAALIDPSPLASAGQSPPPIASSWPSPNSCPSRAASCAPVPSHCACAREPIEASELRAHMPTTPMRHFGRRAVLIPDPDKPRHYADTPGERQCESGAAVRLGSYCQQGRRVVKNHSQKEICTCRRDER
jgi:hypothetical protein